VLVTFTRILIFIFGTGGGRSVVYGTDDGVYISDLRDPNKAPVKVLALLEVSQVSVLEDYQLLIVLSGQFSSVMRLCFVDRKSRTSGDNIPS
jgi:RHO1 GDP-GTP exchange protein 1/2